MTRINTNVSSLIAQTNLSRANNSLNTALTRLSTGLKINTGADDPAGLIATQSLQSDIIGVQTGISNSQQANSVIATADSALGQVSSLLDSIRGLVSQSANTGALSAAQVAANQLQVDSSLQAIDRIASNTTFGGQRLLDGSLDFVSTSAGNVTSAASGSFGAGTAVAATNAVGKLDITAKTTGTTGNGGKVEITTSAVAGTTGGHVVLVTSNAGKTLTIHAGTAATYADVLGAVSASSSTFKTNFTVAVTAGGTASAVAGSLSGTTSGGVGANAVVVTAKNNGPTYNGVNVDVTQAASAGAESVAYNTTTNTLTVSIQSSKNSKDIASAIHASSAGITSLFTASAAASGTISFTTFSAVTTGGVDTSKVSNLQVNSANFGTASQINVGVTINHQATQGQLTYAGGTLTSALVLQIGGSNGYNVFNFSSGSTVAQISTAINGVSDATGVTANVDNSGNLTLTSQNYGSAALVSAQALSGSFATTNSASATVTRSTGTDVQATINGLQATGSGLQVSLDSPTLNLNFSVSSNLADNATLSFAITGGGANFQLGPEVNSNEQARLGIQSISTAKLGGTSGTLYELQSGGDKSLSSDVNGAASIVDQVITQVTNLRGRLGAFQQTTLQTNINTLQDTLSNLTSAQSSIQDADFAAESANLTRAQILVQSGTSVLSIANHNPENVLSLLK